MIFKPTSEFPLLKLYQEKFYIDKNTIFAYDGVIYTNNELPENLIVHERTHLKQQEKYGLAEWVKSYLEDENFRIKMETQAYRNQLRSISDRNDRARMRMRCAIDLSGNMYGNIMTYDQAFKSII